MRRVIASVAVSGAVLLGTAAPASAACELPKGWYTSQAELRYATDLYTGKLEESVRTPSNTSNLVAGNANRTVSWLAAVQRYAQALPSNGPRC